jgi:DNA polymerase-3 subunit beta
MKITVETTSLSRELFKLQGIASARSSVQMAQFALLTATKDGQLTLQATDMELSLTARIDCITDSPGQIAIRARDFHDVVKNLRTETLTLTREENHWALLEAGTVRARLVGAEPSGYPKIPSTVNLEPLKVRTTSLQRLIDRTLFSVSQDEARPNLTGALLRISDAGRMQLVSTDGHRLSKAEMPVPFATEGLPVELRTGVIVPRKGLDQLRRTLDVTEGTTAFGLEGTNIIFIYGNTTLTVRLIDGTFPNFEQVIPAPRPDNRASIGRKEFLDRLKFVSLFSSAKTNNVRIHLEEDTCIIAAQDPERGEGEERIQIEYAAGPVKAGFNHKYLTDILSVVDGDRVSMEMTDALSATVFRELDGEDGEESLFIVMPMRI